MKKVLLIILPIIFLSPSLKSNELQFSCTMQYTKYQKDTFGEFHSQKYVSLEISQNKYLYYFDALNGGRYFLDKSFYNDDYSEEELSKKFPIYNKLDMVWNKNYLRIEMGPKGKINDIEYFDFISNLFIKIDAFEPKLDRHYICKPKLDNKITGVF